MLLMLVKNEKKTNKFTISYILKNINMVLLSCLSLPNFYEAEKKHIAFLKNNWFLSLFYVK